MSNIISLEQWRREREQCRIAPQLQQAARLRKTARVLLDAAAMIEMEVSNELDYDLDLMAGEKNRNLEALHNA